ncbi:cortex morphogenetic protein CmpA [Paenibacillus yonginensis]|nr:cortex morphogenetic protein CmpA [Paenibacillus yonginensis]
MPKWLCNQMMSAFYKKDRRQVKLLNDCWFFYHNRKSEPGSSEALHAE